jgi:hypothetical protein
LKKIAAQFFSEVPPSLSKRSKAIWNGTWTGGSFGIVDPSIIGMYWYRTVLGVFRVLVLLCVLGLSGLILGRDSSRLGPASSCWQWTPLRLS